MKIVPLIRNPNSLSSTVMKLLMVSGLILSTIFIAAQGWAKTDEDRNKPSDVRINLLLSGGGTRAAAFAYGAMYELGQLCYPPLKEDGTIDLKSQPVSSTLPCRTVLEEVDRISAVSGGSITAGYYMIHRQDGEFPTFPTVLRKGKITRELITTDRPGSLWRFLRPPALVATSVVDTIFSVLSLPLFFLPIHFEFTPPAAMALTDGIIESGQLASAYDDLYFDGKTLGSIAGKTSFPFGSIVPPENSKSSKEDPDDPELLIHATDIANGKVFTFDKDTFECLGVKDAYNTFPLSLAAAASSSLPGIFAPVQLDEILESASPLAANHDKCSLIANDKMRPPLLVDGGVSDNLGVGGILSKVFEEKRLPSDQPNQQDFLIIVDSGTETESDLPGLAGHIDNSFDALIKDKTALSKLMANGLLSQFGFQTLELKLSDVVTDPLIRQLATEFIGHQNHVHSSQSNNHEKLIEKGYTASELERKVLDDLNRSGMTPSAEQIDTLIAAGRAVVRAHYQKLKDELLKANWKQFSPTCENVSNFAKFYCWPVEFEQPYLATNRIGPLLQALTETGNAIRDRAAQNRIKLGPSLRDIFRDYINMKNESSKPRTLEERVINLFKILGMQVDNDDKFDQLMNEPKSGTREVGPLQHDDSVKTPEICVPPLPTQPKPENAIGDSSYQRWARARTSLDRILKETPFKDNLNEQTLSDGQKQCIKTVFTTLNQMEPELHDIPQYYLLQASLANLLDKTDLVRSLLHTGMDKFQNSPSMQARAGLMLLIDLDDYRNGLDRLEKGHTLLKQRIFKLHTIEKSLVKDQSVVSDLLEHYIYREQVLKQWLSFALATAPFPVPGDTRYVSDRQVHEWELTHLPSKDGESLFDWLKDYRASLEENIQTPPCVPATSWDMFAYFQESCIWFNQIIREHSALHDSLERLMTNLWRCSTSQKDCFGSYATSNLRWKMSQQVDALRVEIKKELAKMVGLERAEEHARESYEWFHEKEKKDKARGGERMREQTNSAAMYGIVLLIKNASLSCPARDGAIKKSEELFKKAWDTNQQSTPDKLPRDGMHNIKGKPLWEKLLWKAQDTEQQPTPDEPRTFSYNDLALIAQDLLCQP